MDKMQFTDLEWLHAWNADEKLEYYVVNGRFIKQYKPSVAKLLSERTKWSIKPLKGQFNEEGFRVLQESSV